VDDNTIPGWATGPDGFENDTQRRAVEHQRDIDADDMIAAYCLGDLHTLANTVEAFQQSHRLL